MSFNNSMQQQPMNRARTRNKNSRRIPRSVNNNRVTPNLGVRDIMPFTITRELNYADPNFSRFSVAANYLVYSFKINDLYDPDPLPFSESISGFNELMAFYFNFLVLNFRFHLEITNNEAFPLIYGVVFNTIPLAGVVANRNDAINALENPLSTRPKILAPKGGMDRATINESCPPWKVLGNKLQYMSDSSYCGTVGSSPPKLLYMNLVIASPLTVATVLANGVTTALTLRYSTKFFSRVNVRM